MGQWESANSITFVFICEFYTYCLARWTSSSISMRYLVSNTALRSRDSRSGTPSRRRITNWRATIQWGEWKTQWFNLNCASSGDDPKTIFDCFFSVENAGMYPPEPIHNLQRMERKVLLALNDIKNIEIRQRHGWDYRHLSRDQIMTHSF